MVEDVVDLPTKLNCMLFTNLDVLEERQIVVEDRRHSHCVAWHVADLSRGKGLRKTFDV